MATEEKALSLVMAKSAPVHFSKPPAVVLKKLALLASLDGQTTFLALQIGGLLWQAKEQLTKHGEFKKWIAAHIKGRGYRSCAYYMKLTQVFVEQAQLTSHANGEKIFAALIALDPTKKKQTGLAQEATTIAREFIGELSITELLIKYGIKDVGLKSELTGDDDAPPALTDAEQAQMELDLTWSQSFEPAKSLADLLAEKARILTPEQRTALKAELDRAQAALRAV
jgi:hypothetical protein